MRFEQVGDDLWITQAWEVRAPRLTYSSLNEGGRTTVWPRAVPVTTAARVLALVPVTDAGGGGP